MKLLTFLAFSLSLVALDLGKVTPSKTASERNGQLATPYVETIIPAQTINPGITTFESYHRYIGLEKLGINILTDNDNLANIRIGVAFANESVAQFYTLSEIIDGKTLALPDQGAKTIRAYGDRVKLVLWNDGPAPVRLKQVVLYSVTQ